MFYIKDGCYNCQKKKINIKLPLKVLFPLLILSLLVNSQFEEFSVANEEIRYFKALWQKTRRF